MKSHTLEPKKNSLLIAVSILFIFFTIDGARANSIDQVCEDSYKKGRYKIALRACKQSARADSPIGLYYMGRIYLLGKGKPKNEELGLTFLKMSANKGHALAAYDIGFYFHSNVWSAEQNVPEGIRWLEIAAKLGSVEAMGSLAAIYTDPDKGHISDDKSEYWLRKAADKKDLQSMTNLVLFLLDKPAVPCDEVVDKLEFATNKGFPEAMFLKGMLMIEESCYPKDEKEGKILLKQAEKKGYFNANSYLKMLEYKTGSTIYVSSNSEIKEVLVDSVEQIDTGIVIRVSPVNARSWADSMSRDIELGPIELYQMGFKDMIRYIHGDAQYIVAKDLEEKARRSVELASPVKLHVIPNKKRYLLFDIEI